MQKYGNRENITKLVGCKKDVLPNNFVKVLISVKITLTKLEEYLQNQSNRKSPKFGTLAMSRVQNHLHTFEDSDDFLTVVFDFMLAETFDVAELFFLYRFVFGDGK